MNPAMMREYLVDKYPSTYTLPGETEIKQQINAFVQNEKNTETSKKCTKTNLHQDWTNLLEEIVQNDKLGTPETYIIDSWNIINQMTSVIRPLVNLTRQLSKERFRL